MAGVYSNTHTQTDDKPYCFEASPKKLKYAYVSVATKDQKSGGVSGQNYPIAAGSNVPITDLDVSKLYFKNAVAGQNGTVSIIGTY